MDGNCSVAVRPDQNQAGIDKPLPRVDSAAHLSKPPITINSEFWGLIEPACSRAQAPVFKMANLEYICKRPFMFSGKVSPKPVRFWF